MGKGQNPKKFGHNAWTMLHLVCLAFDAAVAAAASPRHRGGSGGGPPAALAMAVANFLQVFTRVLQCAFCRQDGTRFNDGLESRDSIATAVRAGRTFARSVKMHNLVNAKLGVPVVGASDALGMWRRRWSVLPRERVFWQYLLRLVLHYNDNGEPLKNMFYESLFAATPFLYALVTTPPLRQGGEGPDGDEALFRAAESIFTHDAAGLVETHMRSTAVPSSANLYDLLGRLSAALPRVTAGVDARAFDIEALRAELELPPPAAGMAPGTPPDAPPGVAPPPPLDIPLLAPGGDADERAKGLVQRARMLSARIGAHAASARGGPRALEPRPPSWARQ